MPTTFAGCATNLRSRAAERFDIAERYEQEFRDFRMAAFYRDSGRELLGEAQRYERFVEPAYAVAEPLARTERLSLRLIPPTLLFLDQADAINEAAGPSHPRWPDALDLGMNEVHVCLKAKLRIDRRQLRSRVILRVQPLLNVLEWEPREQRPMEERWRA